MTLQDSAPLERLYRLAPRGALLGLDRMRQACAKFDHPEQTFASVHIAGTNGKGSVAAMVASIARAEGLRAGLYTSPHLCEFRERIQIAGAPAPQVDIEKNLDDVLTECPELTFFEATTLTAFLTFARSGVSHAIIEVGLGGRLDATNVLEAPRATAITRIAMDHADRLGHDLASIAGEKAGILKRGVPAVLGPLEPASLAAVESIAAAVGAPVQRTADDVELGDFVARHPVALAGAHQTENAKIAVALARLLGWKAAAIGTGLREVQWPGRLETVRTPQGEVLLDAAHNPDGTEALAREIKKWDIPPARVALVFGAMADKDYTGMLAHLAPLAAHRLYVTPDGRRAADLNTLSAIAPGHAVRGIEEALIAARQLVGDEGRVVVAGSIFLVGAARAHLLGLPRDPAIAL